MAIRVPPYPLRPIFWRSLRTTRKSRCLAKNSVQRTSGSAQSISPEGNNRRSLSLRLPIPQDFDFETAFDQPVANPAVGRDLAKETRFR